MFPVLGQRRQPFCKTHRGRQGRAQTVFLDVTEGSGHSHLGGQSW